MGYTKIVQYGNVTEYYAYEKNRSNNKKRYISALTKKRNKTARLLAKAKGFYKRKASSVLRSTKTFFRLCHHNNVEADSIHFFTLTFAYDITYEKAKRHIAKFMERIKERYPKIPLRYISVPELTKKGRYHFHLLVYNIPSEETRFERKTRNFQRLFERGYVDILLATTITSGIAGYMAKYMAKAFLDERIEATRVFNCSRNILKIRSHGSNTLSTYDEFIPTDQIDSIENSEYDVPYLGKCLYTKITKNL